MTLPASGPISINSLKVEYASTSNSLAAYYRGGSIVNANMASPGVPTSGAISLSSFYGASTAFNITISANTFNYNLRAAAVALGWDQVRPLVCTVTINSGIYVGSTSTGAYAFSVNGSYPVGSQLQIINNGNIIGCGGVGGTGGAGAGGSGGPAILTTNAVTITNNGLVGGGGGGGGGGGYGDGTSPNGGSGGGGGAGFNGGAGGIADYNGSFGMTNGAAGSVSGGGAGGPAGSDGRYGGDRYGGAGGSGGYFGAAGNNGTVGIFYSGFGAGGAAGAATQGNSFITWAVAGTRLGPLN